jgi:hypothetical protein
MINDLEKYFLDNPGRLLHKWDHYFDIYDQHLSRFRGKKFRLLEIGIFHGGSLQMWKKYFGSGVSIVGMDIEPRAVELAEPGVEIVIGDQADRKFLREVVGRYGSFDVVIDDGGHTMEQQINSFEELWPAVTDGGLYIAEDLHTSYWDEFGGGYQRKDSFIEYSKRLIDQQNAWHARPGDGLQVDEMTRTLRGMHVYDSVIAFDKAKVTQPLAGQTGRPQFPL